MKHFANVPYVTMVFVTTLFRVGPGLCRCPVVTSLDLFSVLVPEGPVSYRWWSWVTGRKKRDEYHFIRPSYSTHLVFWVLTSSSNLILTVIFLEVS